MLLMNTDKKSRDRDPLDSDDRVVTCRFLPESVENTGRDSLSLFPWREGVGVGVGEVTSL